MRYLSGAVKIGPLKFKLNNGNYWLLNAHLDTNERNKYGG